MEQKTVNLSDVEKNKELFEYEMTEVILQLKGKFSKLSSKDLHLEAEQFEIKPLDLLTAIPEITVDALKIDCPTVSALNSIETPSITMSISELNCPSVPTIAVCPAFEVSMELPSISYDALKKVSIPKISDVTISPAAIPVVDCSFENLSMHISDIKIYHTAISFDVPTITLQKEQAVISLENPSLSIPETSIHLPQAKEISFEKIISEDLSLDIPKTDIQLPQLKEISLEKIKMNVPVIKKMKPCNVVPLSGLQPVSISVPNKEITQTVPAFKTEMHLEKIEVAAIPQAKAFTPINVDLELQKINVPTIPTIDISFQSVSLQKNRISMPKIHKIEEIKVDVQTNISLQPLSVLYDEIPVIKMINPLDKMTISVEKADIHTAYATMHSISIPPVKLPECKHFSLPELPDLQTEIQEIMESIV